MIPNIEGYIDEIAIVVVGYNRIDGVKRLLFSLQNAHYSSKNVPLIISIDASGNTDLYNYVSNFEWENGMKYINIEKERLGLKEHILKCGDLTKYFKAIILLEDDLFVSPDFYIYTINALNKYGENTKIAGISLYGEELNGYVCLPFQPLNNGSDCFAWQTVSSWGEVWNYRMWSDFRTWLKEWNEDFNPIEMPTQIKNWERAWSKYFYAFVVTNDLYFIYPYVSLSTNFNDAGGEHGDDTNTSFVQVSLLYGSKKYELRDFSELVKYDVYQQNIKLYDTLKLSKEELCLDLYGATFIDQPNKRYLLTIKKYHFKEIRSYGLSMRPIELNIFYNIKGNDIHLYDTKSKVKNISRNGIPVNSISYFIKGFNKFYMIKYCFVHCLLGIKRKIKSMVLLNNISSY